MKKKKINISISVLFLLLICSLVVPLLLGRYVGLRKYFMVKRIDSAITAKKSGFIPSDPVSKEAKVGVLVTINRGEVDVQQHSMICQSLGIDMNHINSAILNSPDEMENILTIMLSDDKKDDINDDDTESFLLVGQEIIQPPQCETNYFRNRLVCSVILMNTKLHIYTWPQSGVMTFDIFTCHNNDENKILSLIPKLKGILSLTYPNGMDNHDTSTTRWLFKNRGIPSDSETDDRLDAYTNGDINNQYRGYIDFDMKELIISIETQYQTIDVYDIINPKFRSIKQYHASQNHNNPESKYITYSDLHRPDRVIFLDGILQSRLYGEAAYHEALVHPALFTHPNPQRVAIIGGGEGATLREVLKHNTISTVTMIEIDEVMVNISRQYIPEWSDCTMIANSAPSCFDDPRTEMYYTDAIAWFIGRYSNVDIIHDSSLYDIIIMDALYVFFLYKATEHYFFCEFYLFLLIILTHPYTALISDPEAPTDFSDVLYDNDDFMRSISNALRSNGILISQLGGNVHYNLPSVHLTSKYVEVNFMNKLIQYGFDRIEDYTDSHGGYSGPWAYKIIFKCSRCLYHRWHNNPALIMLEMKQRSMGCYNKINNTTNAGCNLFRYFDGATMMDYQHISRVNEEVFCRSDTPQLIIDGKEWNCLHRHGYDPELFHSIQRSPKQEEHVVSDSILPNHVIDSVKEVIYQNIMILPSTSKIIRQFIENSRNVSSTSSNVIAVPDRTWYVWDIVLNGYSTPCLYWGSSCYIVNIIKEHHLHNMIVSNNCSTNSEAAVPVSNTMYTVEKVCTGVNYLSNQTTAPSSSLLSSSSAASLQNLLESVIYNPYISRNHLNLMTTFFTTIP